MRRSWKLAVVVLRSFSGNGSDKNGALRLASEASQVAPDRIRENKEGLPSEKVGDDVTISQPKTLRTDLHQPASPYTTTAGEEKLVHPRGFEPLTFGSVDSGHESVTGNDDKGLRKRETTMVPTLVPSPSEIDSSTNTLPSADPDLTYIAAAWPDLPKAIQAGILAMVKSAIGHKA